MNFTNKADLSYNNNTIQSNIVIGELVSSVTLSKDASADSYVPDGQLQYTVTVANTSAVSYTGLSLLDNLGRYSFTGFSRFPLSYVDNSVVLNYYSSSGVTSGVVTATQTTNGITFNFDLPGNTVAIIKYNVDVTPFAPLLAGSTIVNTATLSGSMLLSPIIASLTLPVAEQADLIITKNANDTAEVGQLFTFTFNVLNYGNVGISTTDYVVISDQLSPALTNIVVYANNVLWQEGVQYVYNDNLFYFQTQAGAIQLGPATIVQDDFGRWNITPSSLEITITGTVSDQQPTQAIMDVIPAYSDGNEVYLTSTRIDNDMYMIQSTGAVPPIFTILSNPDSPISLLPSSNPAFGLVNNNLTVNTTGIANVISAYVQVNYGSGFTLQVDYVP